jgi:tight adherence protein C
MSYAIISFVVVTAITFLAGYLALRRTGIGGERLVPVAAAPGVSTILRFEPGSEGRWQRLMGRLGRRVGSNDAERIGRFRRKLLMAGFQDPRAVMVVLGAKVALAVGGGLSYMLYGALIQRIVPNLLFVSALLAAVGFFLPDFWLRNRIKERQRAVVNFLPDLLDMLMVCVEAGMGFDAAVARVVEQPQYAKSPLHREFQRMSLEMRAGRPREEALRDLGERTGVQEVKSVVSAFIQTDRLGTPLGKTLRVHAESARVQRRHRAEERAYLAPVKMIFPTVFFLMPAFFLVTMGPSLLMLLRMFEMMGGAVKTR